MRTSFPHPVVPRRVATTLAGSTAVVAVVFLAAGCVAAPAGTATPPASPSAAVTATPAPTPAATPAATSTAVPAATPAATSTATPPATLGVPTPTAPAAAASGTIAGLAHAGPTCPVAHVPPDPACADAPVPGLRIVLTDASGAAVTTVTTGADGRFVVTLPPGSYTLTPQPREGLLRTPGPETVTLAAGATLTVDFAYDTGIR